MNRVVAKFGGSVLREPKDISKILAVIKKYDNDVIIVVSAFYGCTDFLLSSVNNGLTDSTISHICESLYRKTISFYSPYVSNTKNRNQALVQLIYTLKDSLYSIMVHGRQIDHYNYAISFGERLTSFALTQILKDKGFPAIEALPEKFGLITDGQPDNAKINVQLTKQNLQKKIKPKNIYVFPGFYGISKTGEINLLGRGGTDYSAAAIAVCVNASTLDLWKDVEGFQIVDPAIIPDTLKIPRMTYYEAEELSTFGAKILHPSLIEPLAKNNIPIRLLSIDQTDDKVNAGTIINSSRKNRGNQMFGISTSNNFGIISLSGNSLGSDPTFIGRVINVLKTEKVDIKSMTTSCSGINFLLELSSCKRVLGNLRKKISAGNLNIKMSSNIAVIAVVVDKQAKNTDWSGSIIGALKSVKAQTHFCILGVTSALSYVVVSKPDCVKVINAIYIGLKSDMERLNRRRNVDKRGDTKNAIRYS